MRIFRTRIALTLATAAPALAQTPEYHLYAGNTHAHTLFTYSHGDHWQKPKGVAAGAPEEPAIQHTAEGAQLPGKSLVLKPDWQKSQGEPADHYALAKTAGYDFYATTDHSQEAGFQPVSPTNPKWLTTLKQAADATDDSFVAMPGFEYSENDGPGGKGHINVLNSAEYLNALAPGVNLPVLYKWLPTAKPAGPGPVVASFNHPNAHSYADFADRDPAVTDVITMLEVINSNNKIHYDAFLAALDHGWRVSPCCGNDNHGFWGITHHTSRTMVLAQSRTRAAILDAMKHRRTYATLETNLQCRYSVNNQIMGSTLDAPADHTYHFDIQISDPDTTDPRDQITKVEILKDHGEVVMTLASPNPPTHTLTWSPTIIARDAHYFFLRIYNAGGGDAPKPSPEKPVAWLAPVWIDR